MGILDEILNNTAEVLKATGEIVGDAINEATEGYFAKVKKYNYVLREFRPFSKETPLIMEGNNVAFVLQFNRDTRTVVINNAFSRPIAEVVVDKRKMFDSTRNTYITILDNDFCFEIDWSKNGLLYMVEDLTIMAPKPRKVTVNNGSEEVIELFRKSNRLVISVSEQRFAPLAAALGAAMMIQRKKS